MMTHTQIRDYALAHQAAWEAGNESMRRGGRASWSEEDYQVAVTLFNRLLEGVGGGGGGYRHEAIHDASF